MLLAKRENDFNACHLAFIRVKTAVLIINYTIKRYIADAHGILGDKKHNKRGRGYNKYGTCYIASRNVNV